MTTLTADGLSDVLSTVLAVAFGFWILYTGMRWIWWNLLSDPNNPKNYKN